MSKREVSFEFSEEKTNWPRMFFLTQQSAPGSRIELTLADGRKLELDLARCRRLVLSRARICVPGHD